MPNSITTLATPRLFMPDYWNQGFATEIARASLDFGFRHMGLPEIWSWALPYNRASQRVMDNLGFQYERHFDFAGLEHRFYRLVKGEWRGYDGQANPQRQAIRYDTCHSSDSDGSNQRRSSGID